MAVPVISVKGVAKKYRIGVAEKKAETFAAAVIKGLKSPLDNFARIRNLSKLNEEDASIFWALKDVSFEVQQGEVLGIIGHNGAGKSTLLKILSQITEPTKGEIHIQGRVAALLEVGTGFHPELTGRENIYMNGTILGMRKKEIDKKLEEIVAFSGVEKHLDTPVKFYSSGMRVRLGFSVAAHLEPEILIIDEVLSVGDAEFQKKCLGKMEDVSSSGRTVLFVSHNMASIKALCTKGLLLKNGIVDFQGSSTEVVDYYFEKYNIGLSNLHWDNIEEAPGNDLVKIRSINASPLRGSVIDFDSGIIVSFEFFNMLINKNIDCTLRLLTRDDVVVLTSGVVVTQNKTSKVGVYRVVFEIPSNLLNAGTYKFSIVFGQDQKHVLFRMDDACYFEVSNTMTGMGYNHNTPQGIIRPILNSKVEFCSAWF